MSFELSAVNPAGGFRSEASAQLQKLEADTKRRGTKIAANAAQQYALEMYRELGIPAGVNLPFTLPRDLTIGGVKDAALETGVRYLENGIQQKTGLPVKLPRKLTVKELGGSVLSVVPTNLQDLVNTGLSVATTAAASAATSLLVGAGVGSVIPGLGTVVGIAAALGVQALKEALKEPPEPYARVCEISGFKCGTLSKDITLVDGAAQAMLISFAAQREIEAYRKKKGYCGRGPAVDCANAMATLADNLWYMSRETYGVLSQPAVNRAISLYERVEKNNRNFQFCARGRGTKIITKQGVKHEGAGGQQYSSGCESVAQILSTLRTRKTMLKSMVDDPARYRSMLDVELVWAVNQAGMAPTAENKSWLATLLKLKARVDAADKRSAEASKKAYADAAEPFRKTPEGKRALEMLDQLSWLCNESDRRGVACDRYNELRALTNKYDPKTVAPSQAQLDAFIKSGPSVLPVGMVFNPRATPTPAPRVDPRTTAAPAPRREPVKRSEQKVEQLKKEISALKKKAAEAKAARIKAQQAIRTKDAQRQQAASAGYTPAQQASMLQPAQAQTTAAVSQAAKAAMDVAAQQVAVQRAAQAAQVPMTAVQQALTSSPIAAPQSALLPFFAQRTFTTTPFAPRGAEPAKPALPTDRPDLFLPFFRR